MTNKNSDNTGSDIIELISEEIINDSNVDNVMVPNKAKQWPWLRRTKEYAPFPTLTNFYIATVLNNNPCPKWWLDEGWTDDINETEIVEDYIGFDNYIFYMGIENAYPNTTFAKALKDTYLVKESEVDDFILWVKSQHLLRIIR